MRAFAVLLLAGTSLTAFADEGRRVRLGGVSAGVGYAQGRGGWGPVYGYPRAWGGWGPWGIYDPFWYSPFLHPALYGWTMNDVQTGEVKIATAAKDASVYIDGAFAGTADKLRSFRLQPGAYRIEVRDAANRSYAKRVYVLTGKALRLEPRFEP